MPRASGPRQRLCRGLPSAKTPRGIFRRRRGLCRGPFIGHSAKPLPRAKIALDKEKTPSDAGAVGGFFAEGRPSAKKWFLFFFKSLPRADPRQIKVFIFLKIFVEGLLYGPRQRNFQDFFKNSLPRTGPRQRNGFFEIFLTLCRGPAHWPSAKKFPGFFSKKIFAEGYCLGPRQRTLLCRGPWSLPLAKRQKFNFFLFFAFYGHKHFIYIHIYISHRTHFLTIYHNHNCEPQITIYYNDKSHVHHHSHVYYDKLMKSKHKSQP